MAGVEDEIGRKHELGLRRVVSGVGTGYRFDD